MRKTKTTNLTSKTKKWVATYREKARKTMTKSHITINFTDNTLSLTKSFYKKACKVGSDEYKELRTAMGENPNYKIVFVGNADKKTYGNLTIQRMREYIATQADAEKNLRILDRVIKIAKTKGAMYPLTKKWFLANFPEYKMEITAGEIANKDTDDDDITLLERAV